MKEQFDIKAFGDIVIFDKRFKGVSKEKQKKVVSFKHVTAEALKGLSVNNGNIRLLATGLFDGYTTRELAGDSINEGEVITIPSGGNANLKYYKGKFVDSGNILCVAKEDSIYLKYVYYCLLSQNDYIESCFKGTSIHHPFMPDIWEVKVPIVKREEQERIVALLDKQFERIDILKRNAEQQLQAAKDLFQSALKEMLTPKEGWEEKKLCDLYDVRDGTHDSPKYVEVGYPLVTSKNLRNGGIDMTTVKYIKKSDYNKINERSKVDVGDVLFAMIGTIGNPSLVEDEPNYAIKNMALFKVPACQNSKFLKYILSSNEIINRMKGQASGSNQPFVSLGYLRNFIIPIPSLPEQERIAARLDAISEKVKALQANYTETITLCNDLKQSLLKSIFA